MMSLKILLVEDEILIAMHMEDMLIELGYEVVGTGMRLKNAISLAESKRIDLAILDINLAGEQSFPVARLLRGLGTPFVFVSGYGSAGVSDEFSGTPTLQKPVDKHQLATMIDTMTSPT